MTQDEKLAPDRQVSLYHVYALRILFAAMAVFLLTGVAPSLVAPVPTLMTGAARALFSALGLLALLGVRYPIAMIPLMLFELAWKLLWLVFIGLPLRAAGPLDADAAQTFFQVAAGIPMVLVVMPWPYVWRNFVLRQADRWR